MEVRAIILHQLLDCASAMYPEECCGLLLGRSETIANAFPVRNVHPDPETQFEIDPVALIAAHKIERSGGLQIIGYYHSHPAGPPEPSVTDSAKAAHDGKIWAIVGQGEMRLWRDTQEGFEPLSYSVIDD